MFTIIIDPSKCKGLRRVRHRLRRQRLGDDSQDRAGDDGRAQEPSPFQAIRPVRQPVRQRQFADRYDAQGADAHLHRRRRKLRRLRRGDGSADALCRHRGEIRRSVGHRRRHRLQHRLHLDLSLQSLSRSVDQFALRKCPVNGDGGPQPLGPVGLARPAALVLRGRRGDVRHRLSVPLPPAGLRHEDQGLRARYAGLFQYRRAGLDLQLHRPEHQDERPRHGHRRQAGAPQGNRPDRHDASATRSSPKRRAPIPTISTAP